MPKMIPRMPATAAETPPTEHGQRKKPQLLDPGLAVWDQQPTESSPAYAAFSHFRDQGTGRTVSATARAVGKSRQLMERWCTAWRWDERARAWDSEQSRNRRRAAAKAQEDILANHRRAAAALVRQSVIRLRDTPYLDKAGQPLVHPATGEIVYRPADPSELNAATNALDKGIKHQRLALGLPTDVTRQDIMLQKQVEEAADIQGTILRLIEEFTCDECKARLMPQILALRERLANMRESVEL